MDYNRIIELQDRNKTVMYGYSYDEVLYTYQTNLKFHNILELSTAEGVTVSEDPIEQQRDMVAGIVTDTTGGAGGTCIKYAVTA